MSRAKKSQATQPGPTTMTVEEWRSEGARRFGTLNSMHWKFKCPVCAHVATALDWKDAGAPENAVAFSCVGRWIPECKGTMNKPGKGGPCNYAGGGLFKLNPITVIDEGGNEHQVFEFAASEVPPATRATAAGDAT